MADSQRKTANLFLPPLAAKTETINNVTFSVDSNGAITINGTASANAIFKYQLKDDMSIPTSVREGGNAYLYFWNNFITSSAVVRFYNGSTLVDYWTMNSIDRILNYFENLENKTINAVEIVIYSGYTASNCELSIMLTDDGEQATEFQPYSATGWLHSLRKLTTATEAVENPLYSDGTAITAYTIKGNTVQNGTPTPANPVDVNGVGVRTANLFDEAYTGLTTSLTYSPIYVGDGTFTLSTTTPMNTNEAASLFFLAGNVSTGASTQYNGVWDRTSRTVTSSSGYVTIAYRYNEGVYVNPKLYNTMLNTGSTAKPYEPYGYKLPISNGGVTTNIYISAPLQKLYTYSDNLQSDGTIIRNIGKVELTGDETIEYISNYSQFKVQTSYYRRPPYDETSYLCTHYKAISNAASWAGDNYITVSQGDTPDRFYRIKESRFSTVEDFKTYLAQQYANGTPVTIYFVKTVTTTETVTAPSIPTTEGANSITVDTTVQPSEFTATWTGWHNANVKEWDGSDWQ